MRLKLFVAIGVCLAAPVTAQSADPMGSLAPAVQTATDRGALLYLYDEAAWHGSDDLRDNFAAVLPLVGGYVVSGDQASVDLAFYDKARSKVVYRARFSNGRRLSSGPPAFDRMALTLDEQRLIAARVTAMNAFLAAKVAMCSKSAPNVVLLPPKSPADPVRAYLMTPRTSMKSLPLGGHFQVDVAADGKPGKVRAFTKSCFEMALAGDAKGNLKALVVSHLLDPTPTEIHVFSSLTGKIPIYVMTMSNRNLWAVNGSRIRLVPNKQAARN